MSKNYSVAKNTTVFVAKKLAEMAKFSEVDSDKIFKVLKQV